MVWDGGDTARLKAGGVLGLFPMTKRLDDELLKTNRGWQLDWLDPQGIIERALKPGVNLTLQGKSSIEGQPTFMIEIKNGKKLDDMVTREVVGIHAKQFFVVAIEVYAGEDLVFQAKSKIEGTNIQIDPKLYEF